MIGSGKILQCGDRGMDLQVGKIEIKRKYGDLEIKLDGTSIVEVRRKGGDLEIKLDGSKIDNVKECGAKISWGDGSELRLTSDTYSFEIQI